MSLLLKLLPLAAVGFALPKVQTITVETIEPILNIVYAVQLKSRFETVTKEVLNEFIDTQKFPPEKEFPAFVRDRVSLQGGGDPAIDYWKEEIGLYVEKNKKYIEVFSKGPDKTEETEDDIFVQTEIK